jgi:NarL family two-component system response regulator YdfI
MTQIKLLIADNHAISRAGLRIILESSGDFQVIGEATTGQEAITLAEQLQPDVVLMDVNMPKSNGIEATQILHRQFPELIIIAISAFTHSEMQALMLRSGASGYISKDTEFDDMLVIIRRIIYERRVTHTTPFNFNLTHMEIHVLHLLAEGKERQQIADDLSISLNTVKMHLRNLYQKLRVANAADAIRVALENQLLN